MVVTLRSRRPKLHPKLLRLNDIRNMSLINHQAKIQGYLSYKIYDKNHNLKKEINGIRNFITNSGLSMVSQFSLADCMRFISLGSGTLQNTIMGNGTTGLSEPLSQFSYIGSRINYSDPTTSAYAVGACGFQENPSGVSLTRAWNIPTGGTFNGSYTFQEIMVSPGRPTGSSLLCGTQAGQNPGVDASIIADYYDENQPSICSAPYAFSRIITPISVNNNDYLVLSYTLDVVYTTGVQQFVINIDKTVLPPTSASTNWS